jgi:hypothetical protein
MLASPGRSEPPELAGAFGFVVASIGHWARSPGDRRRCVQEPETRSWPGGALQPASGLGGGSGAA